MKPKAVLAAVACVVGITACGSNGGPSSQTAPTSSGVASSPQGSAEVLKTATVPGLGTVLVNANGYVLYMFPPDKRHQVTCTGACAGSWPPATVPAGTIPKAGPEVQQSLIGTVPNPNPAGGRVVTYDGWPLYTYAADTQPGMASGQGINVNGGLWFVMRPSGQIVKTNPSAGTR